MLDCSLGPHCSAHAASAESRRGDPGAGTGCTGAVPSCACVHTWVCAYVFVLCVVQACMCACVCCAECCVCTRVLCCVGCACRLHANTCVVCACAVCVCARGENHLKFLTHGTGGAAPAAASASLPAPAPCRAGCPPPASRPAPRRTAGPRRGGAARTHLPAPRTACTATLWREREKPLLGASGKATRSSDGPARLTLTAALLTRSAGWLASHTATVEAHAQRPQDEALSPSGPVRTPSQAAGTRRS